MVPGARPSSDECLFSIWFPLSKDCKGTYG